MDKYSDTDNLKTWFCFDLVLTGTGRNIHKAFGICRYTNVLFLLIGIVYLKYIHASMV